MSKRFAVYLGCIYIMTIDATDQDDAMIKVHDMLNCEECCDMIPEVEQVSP